MTRKRIRGGVHVPDTAFPPSTSWDDREWHLCLQCGDLTKDDRKPSHCGICHADGDEIRRVEISDDSDWFDLSLELKELADERGDLYDVIEGPGESDDSSDTGGTSGDSSHR